jgi:hypothetical protein
LLPYFKQVGEGLFVVGDCEFHWTCRAASLYTSPVFTSNGS